jgi:Glycosyl transferases group 1
MTWHLDRSDVVVDLQTEATLWLLGRGRNVRVVHRTDVFFGRGLRTRARRIRLRQAARRGDHFIVHTETARSALAAVVGDDAVAHVALLGPNPKPRSPHESGGPTKLLFVGNDRPEKGLDLLLAATAGTRTVVRCVGGLDYPLTDDELSAEYSTCDVVVCPYRDEYTASGSSSLVVAEALAYAVPVVATASLRDLFPVGYEGVVFAATASVEDLIAVLRSLDIGRLTERAAATAPVAAAHVSPDRYVTAVLTFAPPERTVRRSRQSPARTGSAPS